MLEFLNTASEPAVITGTVALVTGATSSIVTLIAVQKKAAHDFKLESAAERIAKELLGDQEWTVRSFSAFQTRLPGIEADELRKILIRAGAISATVDGQEVWGLLSRNRMLTQVSTLPGPLESREIRIYFRGRHEKQQQQQQMQQQQQQQQQLEYVSFDVQQMFRVSDIALCELLRCIYEKKAPYVGFEFSNMHKSQSTIYQNLECCLSDEVAPK